MIASAKDVLHTTYAEAVRKLGQQSARIHKRVVMSDVVLLVKANHGRWVVECPCGAGVVCDTTWPTAICYDCCTSFSLILWPRNKTEIESILVDRQVSEQSWLPGETESDLVQESVNLGVYDRQLGRV